MGEDLVLYKDLGGRYGLAELAMRASPRRLCRTAMSSNAASAATITAGSKDEHGTCTEQPYGGLSRIPKPR